MRSPGARDAQPSPSKEHRTGRGYGAPALAVYPGVAARVSRPFWEQGLHWLPPVIFEGAEWDLRRAGLLRPGDRLPTKPRGLAGFTTMLCSGELRVMLDAGEASARDAAFARFMESVTAPLVLDASDAESDDNG